MCPGLITAGFTAPHLHRVSSFNVPPDRHTGGQDRKTHGYKCITMCFIPLWATFTFHSCIFSHMLWLNSTWPHCLWGRNEGVKWDGLLGHNPVCFNWQTERSLRPYILLFGVFKSLRALRQTLWIHSEMLQSSRRSFSWASFLDQQQHSV